MKKSILLLGVSLAASLIAGAALADELTHPTVADGFVSLAGGETVYSDNYDGDYTEKGISLEGAASAAYNATSWLGFQGDLVVRQQDINLDNEIYSLRSRSLDLASHTFFRGNNFLVGGFAQYGTGEYGYLYNNDYANYGNYDAYYGGGEAEAFLGDATLYAQIAAQKLQYGYIYSYNIPAFSGWVANLEARYFLTPDLKIEGHVGDQRLFEGNYFVDSLYAGVDAEYKLPNLPFSIFAKYDYSHETEQGSSDTYDTNRILVGAKFNFGAETLEQRDRSGASLKPIEQEFGTLIY